MAHLFREKGGQMKELVVAEQLDADGELEPKFQWHLKNPSTKCAKIINPKAAIDSGEFDTDLNDNNFVALSDSTSDKSDAASDSENKTDKELNIMPGQS